MHPLASDDIWMSLNCDPRGFPTEFFTRIPANRKVAYLSRTVGPRGQNRLPRSNRTMQARP